MIKISVIVPVYNNEEYLDKCLSSLCNQTLKDIEIICVNDGSIDSSPDILNDYKNKDNRIVVLSQENQGAGASRNNGIDIAKGEYISFVDADDWLEEDALEKLYDNAKRNDSDMVLFNSVERKADGKTKNRIYLPVDDADYDNFVFDYSYSKRLVMNSMLVVWSKIYRTSFLRDNNLRFYTHKIFNDIQFHIESMLLSKRISYLPEILYNYNKLNESSLQNSKSNLTNKRLLIFDVFDGVEDFLIKNNLLDEFYPNFIQFKITESKVNLERAADEFKEDYYREMRREFIRMNVETDVLKQIPVKLYTFYIRVLNCNTYGNFSLYVFEVSKGRDNFVNKKYETNKLKDFDRLGINPVRDENSIIVSLTSFPERMEDIHYCIYSLLNQNLKPHKVILWLVKEEFPNGEKDLPETLLKLKENGLTIEWYKNLRSYTKLIPALINYPDYYIVTADDDISYPKNWLEDIWEAHEKNPNSIIASRARKIILRDNNMASYNEWKLIKESGRASFLNFPTGVGGVLYFPNSLSELVLDEDLFLKLSPYADDIWFWAMMLLNNVKIKVTKKPIIKLRYVNLSREAGILDKTTLWETNEKGCNDIQINNVLGEFPEILELLINDAKENEND